MFKYSPADDDFVDLDSIRARLRKMSDEALIQHGKAARYMCSARVNMGKPPRKVFVIQLEECRVEWRRRHSNQDCRK